jgi:hypothetical protein
VQKISIKRAFYGDFRKSPRTLYDEVRKKKKRLWEGEPTENEAYLFISMTGNRLFFILGDHEVKTNIGTRWEGKTQLLDIRMLRIENSTFSARMLEDYARTVGLTLGLQTLEEWFKNGKRVG